VNAVPRLPLKSPGLLHATFVVIYPFQLQLLMHMTMINRKMVYPFPLTLPARRDYQVYFHLRFTLEYLRSSLIYILKITKVCF